MFPFVLTEVVVETDFHTALIKWVSCPKASAGHQRIEQDSHEPQATLLPGIEF